MPGAEVLANKAGTGGVERSHDVINKRIRVGSSGVALDHDRRKAVDRRLNKKIGNRENRVLKAGGKSEIQKHFRFLCVKAELSEPQSVILPAAKQRDQDQGGGEVLREDTRQRHAVLAHPAHNNEKEIQAHIQDARDQQIYQRAARIACRAQYGVTEIVQRHRRHTKEIYM